LLVSRIASQVELSNAQLLDNNECHTINNNIGKVKSQVRILCVRAKLKCPLSAKLKCPLK